MCTQRQSAPGRGCRVLLIDGEPGGFEALASALGASVQHVSSVSHLGAGALPACELVIVDADACDRASLPRLEELLAALPHSSVFLTGVGWHFPDPLGLPANLLGSLRKPWDASELAAAMGRAVALRQRSRPPERAFEVEPEHLLFVGGVREGALLRAALGERVEPWTLTRAACLEQAATLLMQCSFDAIVADLRLPDACGLDAVTRLRRLSPATALLVLGPASASPLLELALELGAQDVLHVSTLDPAQLWRALRFARLRARAQAELQHGAMHDELTSLARRTLLQQRMASALARSRRLGNTFALIFVDLDHFKWINDTYGHDVGDAVLVTVSQRLRAAVREYDTVARLGGDEFAILLDSLDDPAEAEIVAQRVLASLASPLRVQRREVDVTASIGVSVFPAGGSGVDDLLRTADQAMYCAKRAGRNTYSLAPPAPAGAAASLRLALGYTSAPRALAAPHR